MKSCVECAMPLWDGPNATKYCDACLERRAVHRRAVRAHRLASREVPMVNAVDYDRDQRRRDMSRGY